jgi:hypothetical protein
MIHQQDKHQFSETAPFRFRFEDDFVEDNIRCIPMIVRFKLDATGIKLKLAEWSRFSPGERDRLAVSPCNTPDEKEAYRSFLCQLVVQHTGKEASRLQVDRNPAWADLEQVHPSLQAKASEHNWFISIEQWKSLTNLQRFALLKLYRPGHENKNFPKAMKEFKLVL